MNEFKVGDPVECLLLGKGVVEIVDDAGRYPVRVRFDTDKDFLYDYTLDGRYLISSKNICLTKGTWKVEEVLPEVTYKQGELVWCDIRQNGEWQLATYTCKAGEMHHITTKVGSAVWGVSSKCIRKFKDTPYDIND